MLPSMALLIRKGLLHRILRKHLWSKNRLPQLGPIGRVRRPRGVWFGIASRGILPSIGSLDVEDQAKGRVHAF